jgi:hypothetical protein
VPKIGVLTHDRPLGPAVLADLDTLVTALYVESTDRIIPTLRPRRGPGRPPQVTDAELVCLAVAQVLLGHHDERHWLRAAPARVGHLFPRLLSQRTRPGQLPCLAAPAGGGDHLDAQAPARPGPSRRWHPLGVVGPRPAGLLTLNAGNWFNWQIGATPRRSLVAYDQ